jgi:hypothetical protein
MRLITIACMFSLGLVAFGQDEAAMVSKVEAVQYPALSRQARVQGDVWLRVGPEGVKSIHGHPLLTPVAFNSIKDLGKLSETEIDVLYHFILVDPTSRIARKTVKKGDAFDRLILRLMRIKTEKVVEEYECIETKVDLMKNRIDLKKNPVEVWIYGLTGCLQTSSSFIALR